jgi:hypothetical protein
VLRIAHFRPSPALVVASVALLLTLTGTGIAAVDAAVPNNSVGTTQLKDNAVTSAKIASNAVTSAKIASNAVTSAKIASNAVTSAKIASNAVTSAKIASNAVASAKIASNAVTSAKIAANSVTTDKVAANAITTDKVAANAVTTDKVSDGSLLKSDFKSGELPPSGGFARFLNGPVAVPTTATLLASLSIPAAGNYVIFGKAYFTSAVSTTINCRLEAGSDFDQSQASPASGAPETIGLMVVHVFAAAGTADLRCDGSIVGGAANFIKISAIQVGSLTNSG